MERVGGKLCPLDGWVENHEHVLRHCLFSPLLFDTVRQALGLVALGSRWGELSRPLRDEVLLSLATTQGLVLWAGLKAQW